MFQPPRQEIAVQTLGISSRCVVNWFSYCRSVCLDWCGAQSVVLGGPNKIVEIDEAKIGKRKYNKER